MRITDIEVLRMQAHAEPHNNWLFVRIHTDSGITGTGEGSLQYKDAALTAEINNFADYLLGKDPFQIEHLWTSLHRRVTWTGGAVTISAISAIATGRCRNMVGSTRSTMRFTEMEQLPVRWRTYSATSTIAWPIRSNSRCSR